MTAPIATVFARLEAPTNGREAAQLAWFVNAQTVGRDADEQFEAEYERVSGPGSIGGHTPNIAASLMAARAVTGSTDDGNVITASIIASAIAVGHVTDQTVGGLLQAIAAGHDVAARITHTLTGHTDYDVTYAASVLGAVTAANMLANEHETARLNAYGIASTQAARLTGMPGDTPQRLAADASDTAVEASLLAAHGFSGPPSGIDGRRGVLTIIAENAPDTPLKNDTSTPVGVNAHDEMADLVDIMTVRTFYTALLA